MITYLINQYKHRWAEAQDVEFLKKQLAEHEVKKTKTEKVILEHIRDGCITPCIVCEPELAGAIRNINRINRTLKRIEAWTCK